MREARDLSHRKVVQSRQPLAAAAHFVSPEGFDLNVSAAPATLDYLAALGVTTSASPSAPLAKVYTAAQVLP